MNSPCQNTPSSSCHRIKSHAIGRRRWSWTPAAFLCTTLAFSWTASPETAEGAPSTSTSISARPGLGWSASDSILIHAALATDARSLALGEASVADPRSAISILSNPGSLGLTDLGHAVTLGSGFDANSHRMSHQAAIPILRDLIHQVAVSGGWEHDGSGSFSLLDRQPAFQSGMRAGSAGAAYAVTIKRRLSIGIHQQVHIANLDGQTLRTTTSRLGVMLRPDRHLSYGLALDGIGRRPGIELEPDGSMRIRSFARPERIEIGGRFVHPLHPEGGRSLTLVLASSKEFGAGGLLFKGGLEIEALSWIALRGGFLVDTRTDEDGPRAGIGLRSPILWLDYGIAYSDRRGEYLHQLTLVLPLRSGDRQ